jgi:hypothetical protein
LLDAFGRESSAPQRAEAGWPGTLKRLPVSVTLVPSTRKVEKNQLPARAHASLLSHARLFAVEAQIIPQAQASIEKTKRLIVEAEQLLNRR